VYTQFNDKIVQRQVCTYSCTLRRFNITNALWFVMCTGTVKPPELVKTIRLNKAVFLLEKKGLKWNQISTSKYIWSWNNLIICMQTAKVENLCRNRSNNCTYFNVYLNTDIFYVNICRSTNRKKKKKGKLVNQRSLIGQNYTFYISRTYRMLVPRVLLHSWIHNTLISSTKIYKRNSVKLF
jgi:hypothetical protein